MTKNNSPLFRRHGDVNLHPVDKTEGKLVKHNGQYILAEGEATGSIHLLSVDNPADLEVSVDNFGDTFYKLMSEGTITHTHDHETIKIPPGIYKQVPERELDHFADSIQRRVVD